MVFFLKRLDIQPGDLVLQHTAPLKDGRFWRIDMEIADPRWFCGDTHAVLLIERLNFADGNRVKALRRANAYRKAQGYVLKTSLDNIRNQILPLP